MQHAGRVEIRITPDADWMVDEVPTKILWIGHFVLVFIRCIIEAPKVEHCANEGVGLLVAVGSSFRFGCQHAVPRRIHTLSA